MKNIRSVSMKKMSALLIAPLLFIGCSKSGVLSQNITSAAQFAGAPAGAAPNDEFFSEQWALNNTGTTKVGVQLDDLHTVQQPGKKGVDIGYLQSRDEVLAKAKSPVIVAVIDYGADLSHPDLQGRLVDGAFDFIGNQALGLDALGKPDPSHADPQGHGTHVTGIIVGNANNKTGIVGVTPPTVKVLPLNVLSDQYKNYVINGLTVADYATKAINYAVDHKANIINMSLGWPKILDTAESRAALDNAVKAGVLVVVSAGNNRKEHPTYPCSHPGVLCVGALSNNGQLSFYSNYGASVDVLAPGDEILSTWPTTLASENFGVTGFEKLTGTSQATPLVTSIAAILKSIDPKATTNELIARILQSTSAPPTALAAQYGLVNIKRAIEAKPSPTYSPNFRTIEDSITFDEATLTATGTIQLKNLWASATDLSVNVKVNDVDAGTLTQATLAGDGTSLDVPWTYKFASLDESAIVHLVMTVSDSVTVSKTFESNVTVSRPATGIPNQTVLAFNEATDAADLIVTTPDKRVFSKLLPVGSMGDGAYTEDTNGIAYYKINVGTDKDKTLSLQIFSGKDLANPKNVVFPGVSRILHVMRIDLQMNGQLDWLIIGAGHNATDKNNMIEFYILDSNLNPKFGNASVWQFEPEDPIQTKAIVSNNYEDLNSWIRGPEGFLLPAILMKDALRDKLPKADNFSSLDARSTNFSNHLMYMSPPKDWRKTKKGAPVMLDMHAIDNKEFEDANDKLYIVNALPQTRADMLAGHIRLLLADDTNLGANVLMMDVPDTTHKTISRLPKWDLLSAVSSTPVVAKPGSGKGDSIAFLKFYDEKSGGISWARPDASLEPLAEFKVANNKFPDPIKALLSAYESPSLGHLYLLATNFNIVVLGDDARGQKIFSEFPFERETTDVTEEQMHELVAPFLIGSKVKPQPALVIDSTPLRGNLISMVTWNAEKVQLEKTLRYSIQVPPECLNMSQVYLSGDLNSFAFPFLCSKNKKAFLHVVQPQK